MWKKLNNVMSRRMAPAAGLGRNSRRTHRLRPAIECLEGRLTPATFTVTTALDVVNPTDGKVSLARRSPGPTPTPERTPFSCRPGSSRSAPK